MIVSDVQTAAGRSEIGVVAGVSDNIYGIDLEKGTQIWKRHFDSTYTGQPGGPRAVPAVSGRADRHAGDRADRTRLASTRSTRSRGTAGCVSSTSPRARSSRPPEPFLPRERQAVRPEPVQERALHDDRAGLRRQSESVLRVRPGDEEGRQLQSRAAAGCGRGSDRRLARTGASTPAAATATTSPRSRSTARRSSR